ncbi:MAG: ATP phosphoribosyltransferase regulatory subunit [Piscirickettsiaceae bacterium]|nr:MAG: ATP phosphoribosyltransferase regulatory subunit [Piscirickettsiaceae bacterium]
MANKNNWMLPEGIEELLPENAARLEKMRRELLDLFSSWGYQYVIPPLVEYLDSLLTGTGPEIDLQTFKVTDQISGRTLGIRADMTPQVARIAVHQIRSKAPTRLCYLGSVLQARGAKIEKSRSPIQVGAELYGSRHIKSDVEVIQLMLEVLAVAGLQNVHLDLGHVGIFRGLSKQSGLSEQQEADLFDVLQRKSTDEVEALLQTFDCEKQWVEVFQKLLLLNGDISVLEEAKKSLSIAGEAVQKAISELQDVANIMQAFYPSLPLYFDLAELRCYQYQTGIVFAAFVPGFGSEVARGGRYDAMAEEFGCAQPATGFSADIKVLARLSADRKAEALAVILAPNDSDPELYETIRDLRASGKAVVQQLPDSNAEPSYTSKLCKHDGRWVVR